MRHDIEFGERCSAEEGVIAAAKRCNVEDQVLASEVIWRSEHYFECYGACPVGLHSRNDPFEGGVSWFNPGWIDPHISHCILEYQVEVAPSVH